MDEITRIGQCSMCQERGVLVNLACKHCRDKFGPRCGFIAHEIRTNPSFSLFARKLIREEYADPRLLPAFEKHFGITLKIVE